MREPAKKRVDAVALDSTSTLAGSGQFERDSDEPVAGCGLALVVCKDTESKKWAPRWLQQNGFTALVVDNVSDAIVAVQESQPNIAIIDACIRDHTGERLFEVLRRAGSGIVFPTLVVCSNAQEIGEALEAQATDVVRRPMDWRLISLRAARIARSFRSVAELDNARTALQQALTSADDARRHLARSEGVDRITGLPNRTKFRTLIESALKSGTDTAVFVVGLDRFHLVNASFGFEYGNRVLAEVGKRIRKCLQVIEPGDETGSRFVAASAASLGGVRFGLLVMNGHLEAHLDNLRHAIGCAISEPVDVGGQSVHLSMHIGMATSTVDGASADRLLSKAEHVMLRTKRRGKVARAEDEPTISISTQRLLMDRMLREAIARRDLELYYQPLVDLSDGRIVGAEALIRWTHAERGPVSPGEFIPVAEESNLMVQIGEFVIDTACRQLRSWIDAGLPPLRMAVNLSLCQLLRSDVASTIKDALETYQLDPQMLELELSERGVVGRDKQIAVQLNQLKGLGVRLSLDDFGTGDAAIAYLKELPIDVLKIDRSYVVGALQKDGKDEAIASALIALAQKLKLKVIAEGIETIEQLELFRSWGCHEYQGFHYSPAVPGDAFVELVGRKTT